MIMNTIMPEDQVFEGYESFEPHYVTVNLNGCEVEVEPFGQDQARIVRLHSPNPQHYLDPQWMPGTIINTSWTQTKK